MAQSQDWDYSFSLHTVYMSNVISGLRPFLWHGKGLERTIWEDTKEAWQSLICWETWDQRCNLAPVQQQQMFIRMSPKGNMRTQNIEMYPWAMLSCICCELTFDCYISSPTGSCYTINFASLQNLPRHNYVKYRAASHASGIWASGCHMDKDRRNPMTTATLWTKVHQFPYNRNSAGYLLTILSMCVSLFQSNWRNTLWILAPVFKVNPIVSYRLDKKNKLLPFATLSTSNVTHFTVRGSESSYQHSAENTCFGIIKLRSKESTSRGKEEPDPLSTQRLLCRKWAFRACSHQPLRYYNCIRGNKWSDMQYTCGTLSNDSETSRLRCISHATDLFTVMWKEMFFVAYLTCWLTFLQWKQGLKCSSLLPLIDETSLQRKEKQHPITLYWTQGCYIASSCSTLRKHCLLFIQI